MTNPFRQGKAFTFHGAFTSKILAAKRERATPGSFIVEKDGRYYVLKPKRIKSVNPSRPARRRVRRTRQTNPRGVLIYEKITRVEGTKGKNSKYPGERFFHNFKKPYPKMFGLPDGSLLITSKK
jgi:hypothetical protein